MLHRESGVRALEPHHHHTHFHPLARPFIGTAHAPGTNGSYTVASAVFLLRKASLVTESNRSGEISYCCGEDTSTLFRISVSDVLDPIHQFD